jgi:hypothetical protein
VARSSGCLRAASEGDFIFKGGTSWRRPHPHESVATSCLLGDVLAAAGTDLREFTDLEPLEVAVLHPGRTLLEKLVHIHAVAQELAGDAARQPDRRSGRPSTTSSSFGEKRGVARVRAWRWHDEEHDTKDYTSP